MAYPINPAAAVGAVWALEAERAVDGAVDAELAVDAYARC